MGREVIKENERYAVRETVSDETLVTPWFQTKEELIDYLVEYGDDWESGPIPRSIATKFVEIGSVPSCMISNGKMYKAYQCVELMNPPQSQR